MSDKSTPVIITDDRREEFEKQLKSLDLHDRQAVVFTVDALSRGTTSGRQIANSEGAELREVRVGSNLRILYSLTEEGGKDKIVLLSIEPKQASKEPKARNKESFWKRFGVG